MGNCAKLRTAGLKRRLDASSLTLKLFQLELELNLATRDYMLKAHAWAYVSDYNLKKNTFEGLFKHRSSRRAIVSIILAKNQIPLDLVCCYEAIVAKGSGRLHTARRVLLVCKQSW